jgi:hypothetical protein
VDRLLKKSKGNLYTLNELNRIGELSETEQVRTASNMFRMSDVADVTTPPDALSQHELHRLGEPLTGAIFDIFVEVYQDILLDAGLIDAELAALSDGALQNAEYLTLVERRFAAAYQNRHDGFKACLLQARDYLGTLLANTWMRVPVHFMTFRDVSSALLGSDSAIAGARFSHLIRDSLAWREISAPDVGDAPDPSACQCAACQQRRSSVRRTRPHCHLPYSERWSLRHEGSYF